MKYFMQSLKPTLITFIPIIIIFAWLNAHMGYYPIVQNEEFSVQFNFDDSNGAVNYLANDTNVQLLNSAGQQVLDKSAKFVFKAPAGEHDLGFEYGNKTYSKKVLVVENLFKS